MRIYDDYDLKYYPFCKSFKFLNLNLFGFSIDDKIDKQFLNYLNDIKWHFHIKSKSFYNEISKRFFVGVIYIFDYVINHPIFYIDSIYNVFQNERYDYSKMYYREKKQAIIRIDYAEKYFINGNDYMGSFYFGQYYAFMILLKVYKKYAFKLTGEEL